MAFDPITYAAAVGKSKKYVDYIISQLPNGVVYRGAVNYYNNLPNDAEIGDAYTVKYEGIQGAIPSGQEYIWGKYENVEQWIPWGGANEELTEEEVEEAIDALNIEVNITNGDYNGDTYIIDNASITIVANDGYVLPDNINVAGATSSYNKSTGVISLSNPTSDVVVTVVCESVSTTPPKPINPPPIQTID